MGSTNTEHAKRTAKKHRDLQSEVARADRESSGGKVDGAMQAGARKYPAPPFPKQHLPKPGKEVQLDPPPMYDAPFYEGSRKLQDKIALITGGDSGIGRSVAVLFAREGADVAIVYLEEHEDAKATKRAVEKEGRRCLTISGDVTQESFCVRCVEKTIEEFGRLDRACPKFCV